MRWMEQCAYIAASRVGRGGHLLTGSMDGIIFTQPTRVGDVMYITAQVCSLRAWCLSQSLECAVRHALCTCYMAEWSWSPRVEELVKEKKRLHLLALI